MINIIENVSVVHSYYGNAGNFLLTVLLGPPCQKWAIEFYLHRSAHIVYDIVYDTTHYWTAWNDILKHLSIDVVHIIFFFFYWNSSLNVIFFYWNTILIWYHPLLNRVIWYNETPHDMIYDIWKLLYSRILLHIFEGGVGGIPATRLLGQSRHFSL